MFYHLLQRGAPTDQCSGPSLTSPNSRPPQFVLVSPLYCAPACDSLLFFLYLMVLTPVTSGKDSDSSFLSFSSKKVSPVQLMATMKLLFGS